MPRPRDFIVTVLTAKPDTRPVSAWAQCIAPGDLTSAWRECGMPDLGVISLLTPGLLAWYIADDPVRPFVTADWQPRGQNAGGPTTMALEPGGILAYNPPAFNIFVAIRLLTVAARSTQYVQAQARSVSSAGISRSAGAACRVLDTGNTGTSVVSLVAHMLPPIDALGENHGVQQWDAGAVTGGQVEIDYGNPTDQYARSSVYHSVERIAAYNHEQPQGFEAGPVTPQVRTVGNPGLHHWDRIGSGVGRLLCREFVAMRDRYVRVMGTGLEDGMICQVRRAGGVVVAQATVVNGVAKIDLWGQPVISGDFVDLTVADDMGIPLSTFTPGGDGVIPGDEYWVDPILGSGDPINDDVGKVWVQEGAPVVTAYEDVIRVPELGLWVVIAFTSANPHVFLSADGDAWTTIAVPANLNLEWRCVAYGNDVLIALMGNSSGDDRRIARSADDGQTWTKLTDVTSSTVWRRLIWIELRQMFFGTGSGGSIAPIQRFLRSPTGDQGSWVSYAAPGTLTGNQAIRAVAFSPTLGSGVGRLVVVYDNDGGGVRGGVAFSDDINSTVWTFYNGSAGGIQGSVGTWESMVWVPDFGGRFVAVGNGGNIAYSPTGLSGSWQRAASPLSSANISDVAYNPIARRLVALVLDQAQVLISNDGGETWEAQATGGDAGSWWAIAYADDLDALLAVASGGTNRFKRSPV